MFDSPKFSSLRISALFALALAGAGCTVIVHDDGDDDHHNDQADTWEQCYDDYEDCLDDADGAMGAVSACNEGLERCTGADDAHEPTTGSADDDAGASAGASAGHDDVGEPSAEVCVSLQQTCLADADSVAETLACEALFDHCAHPGQCQEPCEHACPEAGLASCLADYGGCVAGAVKDYEVEACGLVFHGCIADLGAPECLPEDDAQVETCLAEHALCTACADSEAELAACQDIFDICVQPPM